MRTILFSIIRRLYYFALRIKYTLPHFFILRDIRKKGKVNVFFIVSSLPMWRLQSLYDQMVKDTRYHLSIILLPFDTFSIEQQESCMEDLRGFFDTCGISYIDASREDISKQSWKKMIPHIIFYQQMYSTIYHGCFAIDKNLNRLLCYLPYGFRTCKGDWNYNNKYTNLAWRLFYPTDLHADYARLNSYNHGRNVRVVGDPDTDLFSEKDEHVHLRETIKKVIWAPHYALQKGGKIHRDSFIWMADEMLKLAKAYEGQIHFILKPHPRLISTLYSLADWGKEKTDFYFNQWKSRPNTQLVTGEYIDLFKKSDAMIHDCGSFTAEYLFTGKPVIFISSNFDEVYDELDYFGSKCLDLHYHGSTREDIVNFLETVVLKDEDPLKEERSLFGNSYLKRNGCNTVGDAIYSSMTLDLFSVRI